MYPQFADTQMMAGVPQVPQRTPYPGFYGPKVPEESPYVGIGVPPRPAMGYGGKPGMMVGPESMYGHGWNANMHPEAYMSGKGLPGKPDYHYPIQAADVYRQHMTGGSAYPDSQSMQGGYPGMPSYPSHPYPSYPPYHSQHPSAMAMGGMPGGGPSAHGMDGYADGLASSRGQPGMGYHPSQMDPQWRRMTMSGRQWPPDMMGGMDGYSGPGHSDSRGIPPQPPPPPSSSASSSTPSHAFPQQQQQQAALAAASPQPNTGTSSELQKQSSVSSIKEALLAATPSAVSSRPSFSDSGQQSQPALPAHRSPYPLSASHLTPDLRDQLNQSSPLTPQAAVSKTPDPLTPRGAAVGGVSSPSLNPPPFPDHQGGSPGDPQTLARQNSTLEHDATRNNIDEGKQNLRVSPFQVEKLLEGKGRKERQQFNATDTESGFKPNSFKSPVQEHADKSEALPSVGSPYSPRLRPSKGRKTPVLSPVSRDHQSLVNQYNLSDEPGRREFLDALFEHLNKQAQILLRVPTVCKVQLDLYRVFTTVQKLGGFRHVVDKRLWKEVVKSFNSNASSPSSSALRTLQEYYVKMLLPYECHLSNMDLKQCLAHYENARRVNLDSPSPVSLPDKSERLGQTPTDGKVKQTGMDDDSAKDGELVGCDGLADRVEHSRLSQRVRSNGSESTNSSLQQNNQLGFPDSQHSDNSQLSLLDATSRSGPLPFSEDSQGSLESLSSHRLPDISVQDAESILGIPSGMAGGQGAPSPSYPAYQQSGSQEWPADYPGDYGMDINVRRSGDGTPGPSGETATGGRRGEMGGGMMTGSYPQMDMPPGGGGSGYPGTSAHRYSSFQRGGDYMHMPSSYMGNMQWGPGMEMSSGSLSHSMEEGGGYTPTYPGGSAGMMGPHSSVMRPPRMDDMSYQMVQRNSSPMMDWQWSQQQSQQQPHHQMPRMPAPLPPHLQPLMFQHSSPQSQVSSSPQPPTTPQQLGSASSSPHDRQSSPHPPSGMLGARVDPVQIPWQDSEVGAAGPPNRVAGAPHKLEAKEPKKAEKTQDAPEVKTATPQARVEPIRKRVSSIDWSNCVEGTKPQLIKRRRLTCEQCGHVEPWRVMMSLKSGLPSDSAWALDTLNILLHDDRTVGFFYLKHHHNLLNTLVDHLRKYLSLIFVKEFEIMPQYELGYEGRDACLVGLLKGEEGDVTTEWMLEAMLTSDSDIVQNATVSNGKTKWEESSDDSASGKGLSLVNGHRNDSGKCCAQNGSESVSSIPFAPLYNILEDSTWFTKRDPVSHIITSCPHTDENFLEDEPDSHPMKAYLEKIASLPGGKFQKVDETPLMELMKREALTERMLIDLRTPKRLMARSPIQKYFLPSTKSFTNSSSDDKREDALSPSSEESVSSPLLNQENNRLLQEEDEVFKEEILPLHSKSTRRSHIQMRCLCISNILRSLSFIPGNDIEFSQHRGILVILGRILMLHHNHFLREHDKNPLAIYQQEGSLDDAPPPPIKKDYWWWDCLEILRENTFVILANIAGQLDLSIYPEAINYPIITGLLHWLVCPSSQATDPLPDSAMVFNLSPQRLVVEALAKMSISEINVDYILATPPLTRLDMVYQHLVQFICQKKYPAVRQFALVILSNFAQGGEAASRMIGQQKMVIPLLIECLESSEQTIVSTKGRYPGGYNPDDPNSLSVAMLRRAAITLHCLTKVPITRVSFLPFRDRLLHLSTLEFLDPSVSTILTDILFELGKL